MDMSEEGRNLEKECRQMSQKKKKIEKDIHDREDQEKMVLFRSVLIRVSKGNRALSRMY